MTGTKKKSNFGKNGIDYHEIHGLLGKGSN